MIWRTDGIAGERYQVLVKVPLQKWYWRDGEGNVRFCLRVGNKRIELEVGKTDIVVGDDRQLPSVIEKCTLAAKAGEFYAVITSSILAVKDRMRIK